MRALLCALGLTIQALILLAVRSPLAHFPAIYLATFALFCISVYAAGRVRRGGWWLIIAFAVSFRVSLLLFPPFLSDDVYRYVWDGRLQTLGINPYSFAPNSPEIAAYRDESWPLINNRDIPTIYPPLAQVGFLAAAAAMPEPIALKAAMTLFDLLCLFMLGKLLEMRGESRIHAIVYAWHPLVLFEISSSGHCDPIAIFFLLLGTATIIRARSGKSNEAGQALIWLSASFMTKLFPLLFAPFFLTRTPRRQWLWIFPLPLLLMAIYIRPGSGLFESLRTYASIWRFNDSVFALAHLVVGDLQTAKLICGAAVAVATLWAATRPWRIEDQIMFGLSWFLLLSPQLDPWRLMWVVPFLVMRMRLSWLVLTGTIVLSYHPLIVQGPYEQWVESGVLKLLEFVPFVAVLAAESILRRRRAAADLSSELTRTSTRDPES
ncbi:MAG: hypothetical protein HYX75_00545 [Acidobacteria bacterium]|nr:hypothetical protein [Acidobacteriota bacterium]